MGRTRTKTKKPVPKVTAPPSETTTPSLPSLLEKAQTLINQCDYELAKRFIERILERSPKHAEAKEMLGIVQLEMGEIGDAKKVRSCTKGLAIQATNRKIKKFRHFCRWFPQVRMHPRRHHHLRIFTSHNFVTMTLRWLCSITRLLLIFSQLN
jgi:hypothetical protein